MNFTLIWLVAGVVCLILEILTPILFFLSISLACFVAAGASYLSLGKGLQVLVFAIFSLILLLLVRPLIKSKKANHTKSTGVGKYAGATAKVIEKIDDNKHSGRIRIFDEEWDAKSQNDEIIEINEIIEIIEIKDMTAIVKKRS